MNSIDAALVGLDAAPDARLTPAEVDRAERLLATITALDPAPTVAAPHPSWHRAAPARRGRRMILSITAVAAGAALVVGGAPTIRQLIHSAPGLSHPSLTNAEIVGWSAVPTHPSATDQLESLGRECTAPLRIGAHGVDGPVNLSAIDRRGAVTTMVVSTPSDGARRWCLTADDAVVSSELIDTTTTPLAPLSDGTVAVQTLEANGSGDTMISRAWGQLGSGVTAVVLSTSADRVITTTVDNGLWTAWWPPTDRETGDLGEITVTWTTSDGATHTASADSLTPAD